MLHGKYLNCYYRNGNVWALTMPTPRRAPRMRRAILGTWFEKGAEMFGEHFKLDEQTIHIVEEIGRHMPGGFFIYKAEQPEELLYANQAVFDIFGCDDLEDFKQLTGYTFKGMLHPDDYRNIEASIDDQIEASDDRFDYVEYRIIRKDGAVRWVDDYGHYTETDAYGGIYYVFISDITEKLLEEQEQRAEQTKLITALAADYRGVYYVVLDEDEGVCYQEHSELVNGFHEGQHFAFYAGISNYGVNFVTGQYRDEFMEFIKPESIRAGLKTERVISFRYMVERGGAESYEMIRFAGVRHPEDRDDGIVHAVSMCFSDVDAETRRSLEQTRALEVALAAAEEANRAKTAFLSNMSHEIRTPMNAIIGLDSIALNSHDIPLETRDQLEKIGDSAQHLLSIINDILDMSRIESGNMVVASEEFCFGKTLEQVNTIIGGQCRDKGLSYECRIGEGIDDYYIGDDMKLRQIMINILGNAVKFTPEGGRVTFEVKPIARFEGKTTLRLVISDTGIGMSKEYLPKLFDTFSQEDSSSTNRYGSTGLGMPITKSLVELMHGHIDVESEKGVGTTFTCTVTLTDSDRRDVEYEEGDLHPDEMSVLVIDDDPVACEHAKLVLGQVGVSCDTALSGPEGIEMVKVRAARQEPYNLLVIDWRMPDMDGIDTTRIIRAELGFDMPIIILTSYNWDDVAEKARQAGVDTFVPKPLFAASVMDEFREAFRKKRGETVMHKRFDLAGRRVLLAEDVAINAEIMVMVLSMREMVTDIAENGQIAVDMYAGHEPGYYDAVLMDMRMPVMDGLQATRTIRAMGREDSADIPIIALTANAFDEDVRHSMQAGLNAHLSKPVEPEALFETLEALIEWREA